ncbi:protein decapping 5-like [Diospyros lotus]|uniref:protein decapping 5-like n=1 Tax=Diospyros lotus TaxID=55363 RepID=UPI002250BCA9|nr:protein decapping 5-like [Diospyros lotus]
MAGHATDSSASADSYIGSFISLVSKAEIRYQGFLFHINAQESAIGLRNVKSFGTEGRKKDGPQVLPSDKVYEYIFFRGSDIKDLQVISSPAVQSTSAVPNDPAIIQSHYPPSASSTPSFSSDGAAPATNISSDDAQSVLFQGNRSLNEAMSSFGHRGSFPSPPISHGNEISVPNYWPGHRGSLGGAPHLQQQSSLVAPQVPLVITPVQQQMQNLTINASVPPASSNFAEFSHSLLPTISGSPILTSSIPSVSSLPSSIPTTQSAISPSKLSLNLIPFSASNSLHTVNLSSNSPFTSPLMAPSLNVNPSVPLVMDKPNSVLDLALPYQTISQSTPSIAGFSSQVNNEAKKLSLLTPAQLLPPGPSGDSSYHLQTADKDIEVVQTSTSESLSSDLESAKDRLQPLSPSSEKLNRTVARTRWKERDYPRRRSNWLNGTALCSQRNYKDHARGKANGPSETALYHTHQSNRGHFRGRGHGPNKAALNTHHGGRGLGWGRGIQQNTTAVQTHHSSRGHHKWGKGNQVSSTMTKFTEDFDFEAMNEKFNKEEIWGQLGKSNGSRLDDEEQSESESGAGDTEDEDEVGLSELDVKPVYVKDDFFDSLSCNSLNRELGRGRAKLSEQRRIDIETFGEAHTSRRAHTSRVRGWGGQARGSRGGRGGYGNNIRRGSGRTVWSRVT